MQTGSECVEVGGLVDYDEATVEVDDGKTTRRSSATHSLAGASGTLVATRLSRFHNCRRRPPGCSVMAFDGHAVVRAFAVCSLTLLYSSPQQREGVGPHVTSTPALSSLPSVSCGVLTSTKATRGSTTGEPRRYQHSTAHSRCFSGLLLLPLRPWRGRGARPGGRGHRRIGIKLLDLRQGSGTLPRQSLRLAVLINGGGAA